MGLFEADRGMGLAAVLSCETADVQRLFPLKSHLSFCLNARGLRFSSMFSNCMIIRRGISSESVSLTWCVLSICSQTFLFVVNSLDFS